MRQVENPILITEDDKIDIIKAFEAVFQAGKVSTVSANLVFMGGEELVSGVRVDVNSPVLGLGGEDLIILINGMSPSDNKKKWESMLEVVRKAKLLIFSYVRDGEAFSKVFQVL